MQVRVDPFVAIPICSDACHPPAFLSSGNSSPLSGLSIAASDDEDSYAEEYNKLVEQGACSETVGQPGRDPKKTKPSSRCSSRRTHGSISKTRSSMPRAKTHSPSPHCPTVPGRKLESTRA